MSDFSESDEDINDLDAEFTQANKHVQHSHSMYPKNVQLELYALYKQSIEGPCNTPKPIMIDLKKLVKWNTWRGLGSMPATEAKRLYVAKLTEVDPKWRVRQDQKSIYNWVVHSLPSVENIKVPEHEKTCFDYVKEGDMQRLRAILTTEEVNQLDAHGLGLLHWATDRNSVEILEFLLERGADVNLQDAEGQTALHYATSCAHLECVKVLLKHGADKALRDVNGQTFLDVADDAEICQFLENYI